MSCSPRTEKIKEEVLITERTKPAKPYQTRKNGDEEPVHPTGNIEDVKNRNSLALRAIDKIKRISIPNRCKHQCASFQHLHHQHFVVQQWNMTKNAASINDGFNRRVRRNVLNIRWALQYKQTRPIRETKENKWRDIIKQLSCHATPENTTAELPWMNTTPTQNGKSSKIYLEDHA